MKRSKGSKTGKTNFRRFPVADDAITPKLAEMGSWQSAAGAWQSEKRETKYEVGKQGRVMATEASHGIKAFLGVLSGLHAGDVFSSSGELIPIDGP
jgi:hypothetical protein